MLIVQKKTSWRILVQRDSAMVMKMIEFVHDHGPRWITATVRELSILSVMASRILRFPSGLHGRFTIFGTCVFKSNLEHFWQMSRWSPVYVTEIETGRHVKINTCTVEIKIKWMIRKHIPGGRTVIVEFNFRKAIHGHYFNCWVQEGHYFHLEFLDHLPVQMFKMLYLEKSYHWTEE